jgi:hypothetical protein
MEIKGMICNFKNILTTGVLFGSLAFSQVFASYNSQPSEDSEAPVQKFSQITPPAGFASESGVGLSLFADFIYWEAREANLDFATSGASGNITSQGQTYYPSFGYQPGFKVGAAVTLGHDNWDLTADYTWLNTSGGKTSVSQDPATSTLTATNNLPFSEEIESIAQADGSWGFVYNLANLTLGRDYYISEYLTLRPFFGLSGAWNHQNNRNHYLYTLVGSYQFDSYLAKQSYWGVGFSSGLNTAWCFDKNWSIYGDFSVLNMWSKYTVKKSQITYNATGTTVDYDSGTVMFSTQGIQYGLQNVIDIQMGLRWQMQYDDNKMGFLIQAGWDQQVWINHAQFTNQASNLSIQGLDLKIRFDF